VAVVGLVVLVAGACSDPARDDGGATTTTVDTSAPTRSSEPPVIELSDGVFEIDWSRLGEPAYYGFDDATNPDDPFWHLHNQAGPDGFFLALEMYTTGYGSAWEGETGDFELSCTATGTGICIHFDPDGEGPTSDLNGDFEATGQITIRRLDDEGYDLVLTEVVFTGGTMIPGPLELTG
jgi:hypothetical protein